LQDTLARSTAFWRALLGGLMLLLVLAVPQGLVGVAHRWRQFISSRGDAQGRGV
jgi:branched-chain amino acid transport system permease protein